MMKKYLFIIIPAIIIVIASVILMVNTYTVEGRIKDIATQKPVAGIKVKISNHEGITDDQGDYKITGIKIYQKKDLVVEAPKEYVKSDPVKIDYKNRIIEKNITIEPTLDYIATTVNTAIKNNQYDYVWDFMHPDTKKYWENKDEFVKLNKFVSDVIEQRTLKRTIKSITINGQIRALDTFKFQTINPKEEYKSIIEIPVNIVYVQDGKEQPINDLFYYQRIDGFYHFFGSTGRDALKNMIKLYGVYDSVSNYEENKVYNDVEKMPK
jgi:hypothetical protein